MKKIDWVLIILFIIFFPVMLVIACADYKPPKRR